MKTMILSDLIVARKSILQLLGICALASIFLAIGASDIVAASASFTAMMVMMYTFTAQGFDELNGWQSFRLTLPLSRRQVVWGRYGSIALVGFGSALAATAFALAVMGIADALPPLEVTESLRGDLQTIGEIAASTSFGLLLMLAVIAISLPPVMRFGLTKGFRLLPAFVAAALAGFILAAEYAGPGIEALLAPLQQTLGVWGLSILGALLSLLLYIASGVLSAHLYRKREL